MAHLGRRFSDARQRARGRQPLRFQLELVPLSVDKIPANVTHASIVWQRGPKLQYTEGLPVYNHTLQWNAIMKQTATMYKENNKFVPKEYTIKMQSVDLATDKRATFAKCMIDLAQYCSTDDGVQHSLSLALKPAGTLRMTVRATWLRNANPDNDAITEISQMSLTQSGGSSAEEQDLSGFDESRPSRSRRTSDARLELRDGRSRSGFPDRRASGGPMSGVGPLGRGIGPLPMAPPSVFDGFSNVALDEEAGTVPKMRASGGKQLHRRTQSEFGPQTINPGPQNINPKQQQRQTLAGSLPEEYDVSYQQSLASLASVSSDEEEDTGVLRRWFGPAKSKAVSGEVRGSALEARGMSNRMASPYGLDDVAEGDAGALKVLCMQAFRDLDSERRLRQQAERRVAHLQADAEALAMSKAMLADRLTAAETQLQSTRHDTLVSSLMAAKLTLAQADYANLELRGELTRERTKVRSLMAHLTELEAAYHSVLDRLDHMQGPPTP